MKMWIDCLRLVIFSCIFYESAIVALPSYRETNINRQRQYWMRRNQISETTTIKPPHNTVYSNDFVLGPNKVRHQSRFTKFDTVKRMIDNRVLTTSPKPLMNHREHHTSAWNYNYNKAITTDKGIFDSDFYVFGNDDYYEDDDAEDDDVDDNFYVDDEDDDLNESDVYLFSDWQAEETTTVKIKPILSPYHSSFTDLKWAHLGTRERVEATRAQIMQQKNLTEESGVKAFLQHFVRVKQEGQCRRPLPKVISVQSEHPDPSKTYTPQCTVLHRCAEDTGCCKHNTKCQYKSRHLVHLYFYTRTIGSSATSVEKLSFYNHSECECQQQNNSNGITINASLDTNGTPAQYSQKCKCPEVFVPKIKYEDYSCSCDCEDNNEDCLRMKKGKEYFGLTDRKCIGNRSCGFPVCEYGSYLNQIGRCPKKLEKLEDFRRLKIRSVE